MANKYWISESSTDWNVDGNWSTTSGGTPDTTYPISGDTVIFNSGGTVNCILTGNTACFELNPAHI